MRFATAMWSTCYRPSPAVDSIDMRATNDKRKHEGHGRSTNDIGATYRPFTLSIERRVVRRRGGGVVMADHEHYVDKLAWLVHAGRDDLIDEIADACEHRCSPQCRATQAPSAS